MRSLESPSRPPPRRLPPRSDSLQEALGDVESPPPSVDAPQLPLFLRRSNTAPKSELRRRSRFARALFGGRKTEKTSQMADSPSQLHLFHHLRGNALIKQSEETEIQTVGPNREQLLRRDAIIPEDQPHEAERQNGQCGADNVIIVPHVQISPHESYLFNRAISSGGGLLADLQRATMATQAFYANAENNETPKTRSPWILRRLYEWSHRAKSREIIKHVQNALDATSDPSSEDEHLAQLLPIQWEEMFAGAEVLDENDKKRLQAVWELFHSELVFLQKQLLVLTEVYQEPLKKCQVEGCLLSVEPALLFGNLEQLCRISRRFCQSFLNLSRDLTLESRYETTDLVVQLFEKASGKQHNKGPSTISAYQAYCINYKATIEYLGTIRQREERFPGEDLLIAPLQRITRLPILLKEILKHTVGFEEKGRIEKQLQTLVVWPPIMELEPKTYIPDFLKGALSRQFCENLLAHPRRKLVHEGPLEYVENGKVSECYAFLFNDMFLVTKVKRTGQKSKVKGGPTTSRQQEYYLVHKQPVPLDSCVFCDADSDDQNTALKNAFVVIHLTRYYQVLSVYTLQTQTKAEKDDWIEQFQSAVEGYECIQLKDMLKCTPLYSSLSLRRCSSSRHSTSSSRQRSLH
ncbi:Pleckstrin-like proteiny and RHoGef (RhoGEF) domain containing [Aphelenchoides fujianensis]|nr:Pleckstrin-like proteiny and RHoGef (RhoGEF) domain containing [Aphelenchoides fujianensis]